MPDERLDVGALVVGGYFLPVNDTLSPVFLEKLFGEAKPELETDELYF